MTDNPYAAPQAAVADIPELQAPAEIAKRIKGAWIAAIVWGVLTLAVTLISMSGVEIGGADAWNLLDAALIFALAYGIYRKSRVCTIVILLYFIGSQIWAIVESGQPRGLLFALILTYYFFRGVQGVFQYREFVNDHESVRPDER